MAKTEFSLNIDDVFLGLGKAKERVMGEGGGAEKGVGRAMLQLRTDMIMQRPTAPIDEGFLRGSTSIFVQNKKVEVPKLADEKTENQVDQHYIKIANTEIVGLIGVNVPYAARHHEVPANFQEPSAGNKYLESKLSRNKKTYAKIVANSIREDLDR